MVYKAKRTPNHRPTKKWLVVGCGVAVVVGLLLATLELTDTTHFLHTKKAVSGPIPTTKAVNNDKPTSSADTNTSDHPATPAPTPPKPAPGTGTGPTNTSGAALIAPYGNFVSNHKPGQNGSPLDEKSNCITTPGASCSIIFKSGAIQKTLEARIADSAGTATWDWNIHDSGLTKGTWSITASSSLNGQTKTTSDANALEVQ